LITISTIALAVIRAIFSEIDSQKKSDTNATKNKEQQEMVEAENNINSNE